MSLIRILCFNIHGGYDLKGKRDLTRIHALLNERDIDIAVFQEMETRPRRGGSIKDIEIIAGSERPHRLPGPTMYTDEGWYGNLIVSRYPIVRGLIHDLETSPALQPRNAVDALVETPHGKIRIIGTHLSLSAYVRWSEVTNLIQLTSAVDDETKYPYFFMGDMNEWRWPSRLIKHLDNIMIPLPCSKSFPSYWPLFRLDRAWYDDPAKAAPNLKVRARTLNDRQVSRLSDHLPLLIEIGSL